MRISDWSSDVCSSDLPWPWSARLIASPMPRLPPVTIAMRAMKTLPHRLSVLIRTRRGARQVDRHVNRKAIQMGRSEEHTSELQSLMRISYAVFCLKKKIIDTQQQTTKEIINRDHNKYNKHHI